MKKGKDYIPNTATTTSFISGLNKILLFFFEINRNHNFITKTVVVKKCAQTREISHSRQGRDKKISEFFFHLLVTLQRFPRTTKIIGTIVSNHSTLQHVSIQMCTKLACHEVA